MGLITKLAWVALPALAGCSMMSQVSSQGLGTNPGGKTSRNSDSIERSAESLAFVISGNTTVSFQPEAVKYQPMFRGLDLSRNPTPYNFGISEAAFVKIIDSIVVAMRRPDIALSPASLSQRDDPAEVAPWIKNVQAPKIKAAVDDILAREYPGKPSVFVKEWSYTEAAAEWSRLYNVYDGILLKNGSQRDRLNESKVKDVLSESTPTTVCGGFVAVARDLCRAMGVKSEEVVGFSRDIGHPAPAFDPRTMFHGVLRVSFSNGQIGVADISRANVRQVEQPIETSDWLTLQEPLKKDSDLIMPRTAVQWELFLHHFSEDIPYKNGVFSSNHDRQKDLFLSELRYDSWSRLDPSSATKLKSDYDRHD